MEKDITMQRKLPAYPLWIIDPMFSVWAKSDVLNQDDTVFWTGLNHRAYGFVRYNCTTYCFMGKCPNATNLTQTDVTVTAFSTIYTFVCDQFTLKVSFVSPLTPDDLQLLSCPVCYTEYQLVPNGTLAEDFSITLALDEDFCYNQKAPVVGGVLPCNGYEAAYFTRRRNLVLSETGDCVAPDWGCVYLAGDEGFFLTESALNKYLNQGVLEYFRKDNETNYIVASNKSANGYFVTAFDDYLSIFYFGEWLKGYFFKDGGSIVDAMDWSRTNHDKILEQCSTFDKQLNDDCQNVGEGYYHIACAALRQSVGAHKLVQNKKGELLFLSKECNSNGCIGTVDISYPSIPLYLIYNPQLVNAMMIGICHFAHLPVWNFNFAPHDIGTYPWCSGQVYGANNKDNKYGCGMNELGGDARTQPMLWIRPQNDYTYALENQMPVEESGNMLIMTAAAILAGGGTQLAQNNFDLLSKWVVYLEKFGLQPENQLCTDDFAGHLANNINLAIKALVGIESYSIIAQKLGKTQIADQYLQKAKDFATNLKQLAGDGVWQLAYGSKDTYSLKYNILFDKLFGFNLIGQDICEREVDYYLTKNNEYGVPLDTRKAYTKSDWIMWTATLTDNKQKAQALYMPVLNFLKKSPQRVPFSDWYYTDSGEYCYFRNRAVQGGVFAPLLKYKNVLKR